MKSLPHLISLLLVSQLTSGQAIICIQPESTSQDTVRIGTPIRFSLTRPSKTYWGRLTQVKTDSIQVKVNDGLLGPSHPYWVAFNQITGVQKSTLLSSPTARNVYGYIATVGGVFVPRSVFTNYSAWSKTGQFGVSLASGFLIGTAFYMVSTKLLWPNHIRQRLQKGWRFQLVTNQ